MPPTSRPAFFKCSFGLDPAYPSFISQKIRLSYPVCTIIVKASSATAVEDGSYHESDTTPTPKVIIDQDSDPDATVVEINFGDRLGALLDSSNYSSLFMNALKNLGLNVVKANLYLDSSGKLNKFAITQASSSRKVEDPELLEAIRLTIINNLLEYHLESSAQLAMGAAFGVLPPNEKGLSRWTSQLTSIFVKIALNEGIDIFDSFKHDVFQLTKELLELVVCGDSRSAGLLVDLVKIITDINVTVESGEFDTEGLFAKAKFRVNYRDKPLINPLQQVLANSLRYFLRRPGTEEASF